MAEEDGFLSRWSRRKVQVKQGQPLADAPVPEVEVPETNRPDVPALLHSDPENIAIHSPLAESSSPPPPPSPPLPPPPTLEEAQLLTTADDFSRFVGRNVDPQVKNAALTKLFSDPHFNVMDGLDTYIGDYNTPDPLPPGMLRKMVQSSLLGLFDDEKPAPALPESPADPVAAAAAPLTEEDLTCHEDPAVRLQPNDDAGPACDQPGTGEDAGRQH